MTAPWARPAEEVLHDLGVSPARGLSVAEVRLRQRQYGRNVVRETRRPGAARILADQFASVIVGLLAVAAGLSLSFGKWTEGAAILAVLAINATIGFTTELKAVRSMESLRRLARVTAKVRRAGEVVEIAAQELVVGDIVLLDGGDVVPADLRLLEVASLQCDESMLTGESVPVAKTVGPLAGEPPLAERVNLAFKGTAVPRGSGAGVVIATGMATELGRIAGLAEEAVAEVSPLEKRLNRLSGQLVWLALALAAVIAGVGMAAGRDPQLMIQTGIALAVASVPEGLPIVATMALARGMWRMARANALIRRLSAVETLGATTVILTDKTGTLTENRMAVTRLVTPSGSVAVGAEAGGTFTRDGQPVDPRRDEELRRLLEAAVLCSNASLPGDGDARDERAVGDPMEVALLVAGLRAGLERPRLLAEHPEVREEAFDSETKMMATVHGGDPGYLVAVKGAPEAVLARATLDEAERRGWLEGNARLADDGLRVLAVAVGRVARPDADPYAKLTVLGLVGLLDPPRPDVPAAIAACRRAGVRVVMVTGDQAGTARNVAAAVGLAADDDVAVVEGRHLAPPERLSADDRRRLLRVGVFARIDPRQKLDLVALHQAHGAVVAMTGDGVNDAPALKKADIGIAMGRRGSQVAREAADMVLRDDAFPSVVAAIEQGRVIFGNIRQFVLYLLSCNLSEILLVGLAAMSGMPLPILPLQILFLNLVTDVFPAFALGAGEGPPDVLRRPPRDPREPILGRRQWGAIAGWGALITGATLAAFGLALAALGLPGRQAVTVSFLTLAFAQLWHVFNMRERGPALGPNEVTRNPLVWGALGLCAALLVVAVHVPGIAAVLSLAPPGPAGWLLVAAAGVLPCAVGQLVKARAPAAHPRPSSP